MEENDLLELFEQFLRRKFLILSIIILSTIIGAIYTFNFVKPKYEAYTKIILAQISDINEKEGKIETGINTNDITLNQKLVSTYSELIKSNNVLNMVKNELQLSDSIENLKKSISVTAVSDTQVIQITVRDENPVKARDIANKIAKVFPEKVQEYYNINNVSVLDEAIINDTPYNINYIKDILKFTIGGAIISIIVLLIINMFDNTIGNASEIEKVTNTNVLASIPKLKEKVNYKKEEKKNEIITINDPKSPASENFRTLRTNIQFMITNKDIKTLLVTSTMPGEGKSWITANLAVAFAQAEKKVIIVDTDMRRGRQSTLLGKEIEPGLSNYLSGINENGKNFKGGLEKCIQKTDIEGLAFISSGSIPPNPSELLLTDKMNLLIQELKNKFDIVLLDGTPSSIVTDSVILSKDVDATMIVTSYKKTKTQDLIKIKKDIENVGGKIIGIVLNKLDLQEKRYQKGYYYYNSNDVKKK